ncbi:ATP-dependent Clp protease proteolytic subunit [Sedimentibacter hydroxybenzoicus DSM 7310]|uniref:ATP-dependent Clp protease proteolytic subunit n=2 Tax=Sedimentibacter hydroxybenzoicus TaxID=29345 RepID=A0A974BI52_SEDHY|nr:ATP-dependent Clp protease proteolytic subunit [Sedimentibacter hydroxybenzoicus]NYB73608.1 ATP-dependent Clp protease proteolytic subunit [Sedimentibacter hydroxybenzoicus DSM 7310]
MENNNQNLNLQQQSFNNMDGNRNYSNNQNTINQNNNRNNNQMTDNNNQNNNRRININNSEPANPFLFNGNEDNKGDENSDQPIENVKQVGSVTDISPVKDICFISIIGEIEGHTSLPPQSKTTKYEHIIPMIIGAEMDPEIKGILLLINTVGGDVEAGLAISELIASITKPTVSIVLGGGHSIGTALAVSAEYSFIAPTGTMTIHPIRTNGFVIGVPQTFRYFQKMQERIINFIVNNSRVDKKALLSYMYDTDEIANDVGTVLNAQEVIDIGLIDEIGGFSSAMNVLRGLIDEMEKKN